MSQKDAVSDLLARTRAIVDTIVDGVITISDQGIIETVNPATERIFGYKEIELRGQNVAMLMPNPYHEAHDQYISNYLSSGQKKIIGTGREVTGRRKDGSTFPLELAISEMVVDGQRMFTGIVRDISERKATENQLTDLLERKRAILATMVDGVITISDHGIIETINPAAKQIFGYEEAEMLGHNVSMLMPNPYREEHDQYVNNYLSTGVKKIIGIGREVTGLRKNGQTFPLELAISEMDVNGQRMFTGIVRDISVRKETEEQLRSAMQRVHEQRVKDEFIATVSHELRTPLTAIKASLELMIANAVGDIPDQARMLLDIAHRNSDRLLLLINDILDISKLESEEMPFNIRNVKVASLLRSAIANNQAYADKYGVTLVLESCPEDLTLPIDGDRIMQVLSNLISNAAKFSHPSSSIQIKATQDSNTVRIIVRDEGSGIPEEFQARIFEKFTQAKQEGKREISGTGLGLYISKSIVEKHGGQLSFQSASGKGTEFYIDLPNQPSTDKRAMHGFT
ncbi:PAS domain-containing sensor histidine kinase [Spongiibacter taiwanensis]|uniref:sensor histidine kinase n=1 Tax=Spongiibacter taiwanensis TaxID=1748242 RepID=UPI002035CBCC|nr:PAS domain-containing sensor histidine kinase [Spongiibacter taiwanensis]USA43987.1 PAS domain-containing sensor histidine kinase [Spongiibacter taiwanensis]